jgi:pimeloyl-ACP methyl ester carboxylesterase
VSALPTHFTRQSIALVDGNVTAIVHMGGHGEPLLYLHGAGGLTWSPMLDRLAETHTIYAPEHPGLREQDLRHVRDVWDLARYYDELLDRLGLSSVAVLGHSFGGMVAAEVAAYSPRRILRLGLIAPVGLWRDDAPVADIAGMTQETLLDLALAEPDGPLGQIMRMPMTDPDALVEAAARMASILHFIWPIPDKGLSRRLYRIAAPTLVVWGNQDRLVPPVYADEFADRLPDASVRRLDGAGHFPQLEAPEMTTDAVVGFFEGGTSR